ncbi:MAG: DNA methyltransferase [Pirellulaceae bacterium]
MGAFEICFYGWREGAGHKYFGPSNATDLWHVKKVNPQSMVHLTEKPVELAVRSISYSSREGENVLDLFGGSGSRLVVIEMLTREMQEHLRAARDHAVDTQDRTGTPQLLPRPQRDFLARNSAYTRPVSHVHSKTTKRASCGTCGTWRLT